MGIMILRYTGISDYWDVFGVSRLSTFLKHIILRCGTRRKTLIIFSFFYHNDTWTTKLDNNVCNLVFSETKTNIITLVSGYFQFWNNVDKRFVKNSLINPDLLKLLFLKPFPLDLPRIQLFFHYFRFCFYFISKKDFTVIRKVFLSVMSALLITKAVILFIPNQAYRRITLLIIWLSFNILFLCLKSNFWDVVCSWFFFSFFIHERLLVWKKKKAFGLL